MAAGSSDMRIELVAESGAIMGILVFGTNFPASRYEIRSYRKSAAMFPRASNDTQLHKTETIYHRSKWIKLTVPELRPMAIVLP
jgi:hypothetical protein